jgi:lipopolysaccharide transport system permease protein
MNLPSPHLLYALSLRQLQEECKSSLLGWLWLLLKPLLQLLIYVVVFGVIFGGKFGVIENESKMEFALGVFLGMMLVQLVTEPLQSAAYLVQQQSSLVKKNAFPLLALPVSRTLAQGARVSLALLCWAVAVLIVVPARALDLLWMPFMVLPLWLLALGLNAGISAISVYLGDFGQAIQMFAQVVFWSSGVFFSRAAAEAEPFIWQFLKWNPVLHMVEESRHLLLWGVPVGWEPIALSYAIGIFVCVGGCALFTVLRRGMADFI